MALLGGEIQAAMKHFVTPVLGCFLALTGCADWKVSASSPSPDGKTIAQIEVALAGTPVDNRTRVLIRNGSGGGLPKPVYVVEADNAIVGYTRLRWTDANHLQVSLCEATSFHVNAENMRNPPFLDAGKGDGIGVANAVWVEVLNSPTQSRRGRVSREATTHREPLSRVGGTIHRLCIDQRTAGNIVFR